MSERLRDAAIALGVAFGLGGCVLSTHTPPGTPPDVPEPPPATPVAEEDTGPRTIRARHVLVSFAGGTRAASYVTRTREEAYARASEIREQILAGEYWLEERMLLDVAVARGGLPPVNHAYLAINDVVISRGSLARIVTIETYVDQSYLTTYRADGVIVSTPTGCTGYALAAGGPILPPELKNILVLPICAHLSLDRPVVLAQGATVGLEAHADYAPMLTVDGQFEIALAEGDRVEVRASQDVCHFMHVQDRDYFYRTLMDRLRWRG